jgi:hypothetical protein
MELYAPQEFNKAKLLGVFENGSPEWHEARLSGIGGSEIGTIMGLNPWESAFTLWHKRAGLIETEQLTSMAVRLGNKLETPVLEIFAEEHPELRGLHDRHLPERRDKVSTSEPRRPSQNRIGRVGNRRGKDFAQLLGRGSAAIRRAGAALHERHGTKDCRHCRAGRHGLQGVLD